MPAACARTFSPTSPAPPTVLTVYMTSSTLTGSTEDLSLLLTVPGAGQERQVGNHRKVEVTRGLQEVDGGLFCAPLIAAVKSPGGTLPIQH